MVIVQVFLSYKWEDKKFADGLKGYLKNPNNKYQHIKITERKDYRTRGKNSIKKYLKDIIGSCKALVCLIGQNTHNSQWVGYELDIANSQGKKIIPVRINNTTGGAPNLIKERNLELIKWDSKEINEALSKVN